MRCLPWPGAATSPLFTPGVIGGMGVLVPRPTPLQAGLGWSDVVCAPAARQDRAKESRARGICNCLCATPGKPFIAFILCFHGSLQEIREPQTRGT